MVSRKGWPEIPDSHPNPIKDRKSITLYREARAKAKAEAVPLEGFVAFEHAPGVVLAADTFTDGDIEVEFVEQWLSVSYGGKETWNDCLGLPFEAERNKRTIARVVPEKPDFTNMTPHEIADYTSDRMMDVVRKQWDQAVPEKAEDGDKSQSAPTIAQQAIAQVTTGKELPFPCNDITECLDSMLICDRHLFEKIMDTAGFAYYFSQIIRIAQASEKQFSAAQASISLAP